jgi:hypothetical protein
MWICLVLAWVFFLLPIPLTVLVAVPLDLAAFILAIICLIRGGIMHGVLGLFGGVVVSLILYLVGLGGMLVWL